MRELPILFSTDMVRALLEGRKTQTRRVITPHNTVGFSTKKSELDFSQIWFNGKYGVKVLKPKGDTVWRGECKWQKGDHLWVRETFFPIKDKVMEQVAYKADYDPDFNWQNITWKPSIHMPKKYARIWLRVEDVWVEQIQDIGWHDAVAEGCPGYRPTQDEPTMQFKRLWNSINESRGFGWDKNPFVWVVKFTLLSTGGTNDDLG